MITIELFTVSRPPSSFPCGANYGISALQESRRFKNIGVSRISGLHEYRGFKNLGESRCFTNIGASRISALHESWLFKNPGASQISALHESRRFTNPESRRRISTSIKDHDVNQGSRRQSRIAVSTRFPWYGTKLLLRNCPTHRKKWKSRTANCASLP